MMKRVTIHDIARRTGVSKGAVWAALSPGTKHVRLASKTRERILKVARALNYTPNMLAKGLTCRKSFLIGFFFSGTIGHVPMRLIRSIQGVCYANDYSLIVYPSHGLEEEIRNLKSGVNRQLDGIITIPFISDDGDNAAEYNRIAREVMPVVQLIFKLSPEIPFVGRDYRQIGNDAVEYLAGQGHRRIGLMTYSNYQDPVQGVNVFLHYRGYRKAMSAAGLKAKVYPVDYDRNPSNTDSGYDIAEKIRSSAYAPTALIACANSLAYGAIIRFREIGVHVPEDISVIGCADNVDLPGCIAPPLTHFPVPFDALAELAVRKCLKLPGRILSNKIYLKQNIAGGATVCRCKESGAVEIKKGRSMR